MVYFKPDGNYDINVFVAIKIYIGSITNNVDNVDNIEYIEI